jgi:lysine 6-dehydrogenase
MRVFCLGGAGRIAREAVLDLATFGRFDRVTIGDVDVSAASSVLELCPAGTVEFVPVDLREPERVVRTLRDYDIVLDGTTISLNRISTHCIAEAGCHGVNLNGFGDELAFDARFREMNRLHIAGFGMTPGVTNLMASRAASMLDRVDEVRISHGAFRPIAFSRSIAETTTYEYDPNLPGRVVYEDGRFVQVPPFARPRQIELPPPYGLTTQYIIPTARPARSPNTSSPRAFA